MASSREESALSCQTELQGAPVDGQTPLLTFTALAAIFVPRGRISLLCTHYSGRARQIELVVSELLGFDVVVVYARPAEHIEHSHNHSGRPRNVIDRSVEPRQVPGEQSAINVARVIAPGRIRGFRDRGDQDE